MTDRDIIIGVLLGLPLVILIWIISAYIGISIILAIVEMVQ